jgi:hypothetical protein
MMVMMMHMMRMTIRAVRAMVVVPIAVVPIDEWIYTIVWTPVMWIVSPIVRRMPAYPRWAPEPIVNNWLIDIYRFNDIISTIYILIAYHLDSNGLALLLFLEEDRCYILIDIFSKNRLYNNKVSVGVCSLNDAQVIYLSISVKVKVGVSRIWVIEHGLKFLKIFRFAEKHSYGFEIKVLRDVCRSSSNSDRFVRVEHPCGTQDANNQ